jgi:hypothetical protein
MAVIALDCGESTDLLMRRTVARLDHHLALSILAPNLLVLAVLEMFLSIQQLPSPRTLRSFAIPRREAVHMLIRDHVSNQAVRRKGGTDRCCTNGTQVGGLRFVGNTSFAEAVSATAIYHRFIEDQVA